MFPLLRYFSLGMIPTIYVTYLDLLYRVTDLLSELLLVRLLLDLNG